MLNREFPALPIVCVGGVVFERGAVALIRRKNNPQKGEWTIPGGMVETGERAIAALQREMREETGLVVEPIELVIVFERIIKQARRVRYHYVVLDYACRKIGGRLRAGSDVSSVRWVKQTEFLKYHLRKDLIRVIGKASAVART